MRSRVPQKMMQKANHPELTGVITTCCPPNSRHANDRYHVTRVDPVPPSRTVLTGVFCSSSIGLRAYS